MIRGDDPALDPAVWARFCGDRFGWKVRAFPGEYYVFEGAAGPGGGFPPAGGSLDCKVGEMMVYVRSDDVEADLAGVERLGSDAARVPLFDRIAVMLVSERRCPTVNHGSRCPGNQRNKG